MFRLGKSSLVALLGLLLCPLAAHPDDATRSPLKKLTVLRTSILGGTTAQAQLAPTEQGIPVSPQLIPDEGVLLFPPLSAHPFTLCEFAKCFHPACGEYEVLLIHPGTGCPVKVCFHLPAGCPKVHQTRRSVSFDYGYTEVTIRFPILARGSVRVIYD